MAFYGFWRLALADEELAESSLPEKARTPKVFQRCGSCGDRYRER